MWDASSTGVSFPPGHLIGRAGVTLTQQLILFGDAVDLLLTAGACLLAASAKHGLFE